MSFCPPIQAAPAEPLPLRGFLRAVRTNTLTVWPRSAYQQPAMVRDFLGRRNVLLNMPDAIHHVLVANPGNYRRSPASIRILRPITGAGLLLSEGDDWKFQRRTIAPALAPRVMPMLARHIAVGTAQALSHLTQRLDQPVNLLAAMQTLALDVAGRAMFSLEMDRFSSALRRLLTEFGQKHAHAHLLDMLLPPSIPTPHDIGRARFRRRWMALVETILAARLKTPESETPRDLFDLLRSARDPETGAGFTPDQLRDQVATLIVAGHETTAVTLFWALIILAQAPEDQDWLAEEAAAATIEPDTAHATVPTLTRTRAVVNETLRLFPPAFTMVREAIGADRIGAIELSPRTVIMIAPWVIHRHEALWDDPNVFLPARFMPDQPVPERFAFLPFGAGPRVCVGAQFAMTEVILVLAAIIGRFRITRMDTRPVLPVGIVTTQPDHPACVHFSLRQ